MTEVWLNRAERWRKHAAEFGLANLDGPTIRNMLDEVKKDIAEHEKILGDIKGHDGVKREAEEMEADLARARALADEFTAALHVRASA